jgi:hypothetical protein
MEWVRKEAVVVSFKVLAGIRLGEWRKPWKSRVTSATSIFEASAFRNQDVWTACEKNLSGTSYDILQLITYAFKSYQMFEVMNERSC